MHPRLGCLLLLGLVAACGGSGGGSGNLGTGTGPYTAPITTEADQILHLDQLRAQGFKGTGIKVGVISTGVMNLKSYQDAHLLPQSIYITQNTAGTLDEGSWMMELIFQHAPNVTLGFCDGDDVDFHVCVKDLAQNFGADIIVDDLLYTGQFYPDATETIVQQLEAANDKLVFVHLSGNEQNGGYWQGPFLQVSGLISGASKTLLDWSGGSAQVYNALTLPASKHLNLIVNWNDPGHGGNANRALTAYLLDAQGNVLVQASGQDDPTVLLSYDNINMDQPVRLVVSLDSGPSSGLLVQVTEGYRTCNIECQPLTYHGSGLAGGTVGDFDDALVVGAVNAASPNMLEPWSNYGPFRLDFSATPDAASPDGFDYARLPTPRMVNKPDLVSPDCVTTPFSNNGVIQNEQFCGTSASVPSVAAAAAMLESAGFNRTRVLKALRSTAHPLGSASWDPGYGFGLMDGAAAYASGGN
jgi:hypothetical protein